MVPFELFTLQDLKKPLFRFFNLFSVLGIHHPNECTHFFEIVTPELSIFLLLKKESLFLISKRKGEGEKKTKEGHSPT